MRRYRYAIIGRQHGSNNEVEIAQCDTNPVAVVRGAQKKFIKGTGPKGKQMKLPMYEHVYWKENKP